MAKVIDMDLYKEYLSLKKFYGHAKRFFPPSRWEKGYYFEDNEIKYCPTPRELELMIKDAERELGFSED